MDANEGEPATKRRRYAYSKCDQCRNDKKGCDPKDRQSNQKCDRCEKKGFQCSSNTTAAAARQRKSRSTPEDPSFNIRLDRFLKAWQWCKWLDHQSQGATWLEFNKTLEAIVTQFSNKLSAELTQLYRKAKDAQNLPAQALLGQLCYPVTMSGVCEKTERLAGLAIQETSSTRGDILTLANGLRLEFLDIRWVSGDMDNCLRILCIEIKHQLHYGVNISDKERENIIRLTEKYIKYCEDFKSTNSKLYKDNYLNMKQDIPELKNATDLRQHIKGTTMDKNLWYLKWLLRYKPELSKLADDDGDTLLHRACMCTAIFGDTTGPAASHILWLEQGLQINRQNIQGKTALHCLCILICNTIGISPGPLPHFQITLRQFLSYPGIDVDVRDGREPGNVASSYLVRYWMRHEKRFQIVPFLECFAELHPRHTLSWEGKQWKGSISKGVAQR
ncbi:hypothetical protein PG987_006608 [Apiospora arundinis]